MEHKCQLVTWLPGQAAQPAGARARRTRLRTLSRLNAAGVRAMGTALLVVRVDLDPAE